ncbi:MAG: xynZ 1 [Lachnospiraceae bacterium]|jgi:S-formylglutathione hydrolase FrmB|nr:xynZ 1 [Lachnospiraceae bacterium]
MAHIKCGFYSSSLQKNANVIVFLPTMSADDYLTQKHIKYYRKNARYQTLILLHGSYGGCMDWSTLANVERYAQEHALAVVMPSAENSNYLNMVMGEDYLDYVGKELPEFLSKIFPIATDRENLFIAGLSMGGYGAMRVGLECSDTFGCIASLSGALDLQSLYKSTEAHVKLMSANYKKAVFEDMDHINVTRNDLKVLVDAKLEEGVTLPRIYLTCGTADFIFPTNETFYDYIKDKDVDATYVKAKGIHDWNFWDGHIQDVMEWLPLKGDLID